MKAGQLHCHETSAAYLGLSGEGSQVWRAGCSLSTAACTEHATGDITGDITGDTLAFSYKVYEASLYLCLKKFPDPIVRQFRTESCFEYLRSL